MTLYGMLARHVMAPGMDLMRGTRTTRYLAALEETQWWPLEHILELQAERLNCLIADAYDSTAYYRRVMDECGVVPGDVRSAEDLRRLPVLTKEIVRADPKALLSRTVRRNRLLHRTTAGSTGVPLEFWASSDAQIGHGFARGLRAIEAAGIELGDRTVSMHFPRRHLPGDHAKLLGLSRRFRRNVEYDSRSLGPDVLVDIVTVLHSRRPACLTGYPSAIALLAAWMRDHDVPPPPLRAVMTGGEQLLDHQRNLIRDAFRLEPFSRYSAHECYEIAMECPAHSGMHVAAEDVIVEIVDDAGRPLPPGTEGRVLITDLYNFAMPFIRYDLGDYGALLEDRCECGRELPLLSGLVGRRCDTIVTPSGRRVAGAGMGRGSSVRCR